MKIARSEREARNGGTALVIVLSVLTLLSILVLGFVWSMSTERNSARSVEAGFRTRLVAQGALSHAMELLRSNIPDPAPPGVSALEARAVHWVTNPGQLTLIGPSGVKQIALHTGAAPDPEEDESFDARSTDLNRPIPGTARAPIAMAENEDGETKGKRPPMRVAWVPVLADPSRPPAGDNPMTGRYAFWIDDESSRLNISVALGKPDLAADVDLPGGGDNWRRQLAAGDVTPRFQLTGIHEETAAGGPRISLGHPWSQNIDVLFDGGGEAPIDLIRLYHENRVHGFRRYPDAILPFVELPEPEKRAWWDRSQWNITFYSRSPEFTPFGKSRFFLLNRPTPPVCGPAYQVPFELAAGGVHVPALYGFPADQVSVAEADETEESKKRREDLAKLTQDSGKALMEHLSAKWPGYGESFADKYGKDEAAQIALNILLMSRFATAHSAEARGPIASLNYGGKQQRNGATIPDKFFWHLDDRFEVDFKKPPMLPQTPGPHLNEIKFIVRPEETIVDGERRVRLRYRYEAEYYQHPQNVLSAGAPVPYPVKVDYLRLAVGKSGAEKEQEFDQEDWDDPNLRKLHTAPPPAIDAGDLNYRVVSSRERRFTSDPHLVEAGDEVLLDPFQDSPCEMRINLRVGLGFLDGPWVKDMIPLALNEDDEIEQDFATLSAKFEIDLSRLEPEYSVSWEVTDPRVHWKPNDPYAETGGDWVARIGEDSMGTANVKQPPEPGSDETSTFRYLEPGGGDEFQADTRFPSAGYLSMIHTGIRNRVPWRTLSLEQSKDSLPDWLAIELPGPTFPVRPGLGASRSLPDHWMAVSYQNSTAGKVNLNTKVYPESQWFAPPPRIKPLRAVFHHLREEPEIDTLLEQITEYQSSGQPFRYIGELTKLPAYATGDTRWQKEMLLRNLASCLTTQSNTFGVWGAAQTVQKAKGNTEYAAFQPGDAVLGEKRFFALIERYIWPGRDGIPGNAHVDQQGVWDRAGKDEGKKIDHPGKVPNSAESSVWATLDGPDSVVAPYPHAMGTQAHEKSSLTESDNPPQAVVKYRVVYYKYLDH